MPAPVYVGVIVSRECSPKRLQVLLHHPTEVPGDSQKVTTLPIVAARQAGQQTGESLGRATREREGGRVRRWSGAARIPVLPPSPLPGHCSRPISGWPSWRLSARRTWRRKRSLPRLSESHFPTPGGVVRIRRVQRWGCGGGNRESVSEPRRCDAAQTEPWFGIGNGALRVWSSSMCRPDMCRCGSRSRLLVGPVSG